MAFIHPLGTSWSGSQTVSSSCSSFLTPLAARPRHPTVAEQSSSRSLRCSPRCSEMGVAFPEKKYDEEFRIGVVSTRWNSEYVGALRKDVQDKLAELGLPEKNIVSMQVPGAFELPMAARLMCTAQKVDAVVCLGVLVKGETEHYEYIASSVSSGLMDLQLTMMIPVIFGVLCCNTDEQAAARSIGNKSHAKEWAQTAMEMAQLRKSQIGGVSAGKKSVGFF